MPLLLSGWAHGNTKHKGSFLTTTQGVELAIKDLITLRLQLHQHGVESFTQMANIAVA